MKRKRRLLLASLAIAAALIYGCSDLSYYMQCASGQLDIIARRRPVVDVLKDPATSGQVRQQLILAQEIRDFATADLGLPDNGSYRYYSDLGRPYVLWNVVATPEFSLDPVTWCFPVAGCVPYRGYYREEEAQKFARNLQGQGHDTWVYGVPAYSTLNWFVDPLLNTFSHYPETALAGMIFHELAHQKVYLQGQADFNESFAETVSQIGVNRWLQHRGRPDLIAAYEERGRQQVEFYRIAVETRGKLTALYAGEADPKLLREGKEAILRQFKEQLEHLQADQPAFARYRAWLSDDVNNAWFASLSTYRKLVPAFSNLYELKNRDLQLFYLEVARIAGLDPTQRTNVLTHLSTLHVARNAQGDRNAHPSNPSAD